MNRDKETQSLVNTDVSAYQRRLNEIKLAKEAARKQQQQETLMDRVAALEEKVKKLEQKLKTSKAK